MRQLSFARRAELKVLMSLNPIPPLLNGNVIFFHEIQLIFFFSEFASHQNLVRADWILLCNELGS